MKIPKQLFLITLFTFYFLLFTFHSKAGGFQINTQGAKALGMGGSFVGLDNDASCVFFNPGGMSDLSNRHELYIGTSFIFPQVAVQTAANSNTDQTSPIATPIQLYYVFKCTDRLSFGLGINNQFGATASYPDDWEGRYIIQQLSLTTYMFQPTVSYKINDFLNVGGGFVYSTGSFDLRQAVPIESTAYPYGEAHLTGTGTSTGYNIGVLSHVKDLFTIGISYHSQFKVNLNNGTADFTDIPNAAVSMYPSSESFASSLTLPSVFSAGISKEFMDKKLILTFDFWRTFWSSYDTLKFTFANTATPSVLSPQLYKDVNFFALGGAYKIKNKLTVRAGIFYDFSPVQDGYVNPELPDANTFGWSLGASYKLNDHYAFDLSFLNYDDSFSGSYTQQNFTASYHKIISVIDVGVNISFGKKFEKANTN